MRLEKAPPTRSADTVMGFVGVPSCSSVSLWERRTEAGGHRDPLQSLDPPGGILGLLRSAIEEKAAGALLQGLVRSSPPGQAAGTTQVGGPMHLERRGATLCCGAGGVLAGRLSLEMG